ncbi:hypothetical protein F511_28597 [Dorcoceras hygrometricum]|uniref:Uncharacterized protein n=1 Tax=Dorcoceras hygrometricum TaxID=472368 RepID=A0A2Z7ADD3_9LAMI|nr:hypothetical protein F511_28597 [Dorcoceras hygrometricum]
MHGQIRAPPCVIVAHGGRPASNAARWPARDDARAIARSMAPPCARHRPDLQGIWHFKVGGGRSPQSDRRLDARVLRQSVLEDLMNFARTESPRQGDRNKSDHGGGAWEGGGREVRREGGRRYLVARFPCGNRESSTCVTLNGSGIQLAVGPQPLRLRNHNFGLAHRIIVKRLATSPHDPLGITDSACKNHLAVVSVQYGPFNTYIPIRATTIDSIGYPCIKASGESSTMKHRILHASGPHPIPPPNDPK